MRPDAGSRKIRILPIQRVQQSVFQRDWITNSEWCVLQAVLSPTSKANMSPTQTSHVADIEPGQLLNELEQRQDDVLEQLDALDTQLQEVLRGLGVTLEDDLDEDLV